MRSYKWLDPPLHNHCADGVASRDPCHFPWLSINRDVSAPDTLWEPVTDLRRVTARGLKGGKWWVRCLRRRLGNQHRRRWWVSEGWVFYLPCISSKTLWKQWVSLKLHFNYSWLLSSLFWGEECYHPPWFGVVWFIYSTRLSEPWPPGHF